MVPKYSVEIFSWKDLGVAVVDPGTASTPVKAAATRKRKP